ncbi:MAG: hypothetical protein HKN74_00480 [Acidimicrobiia bacterium]|nr:hypothetical protein [Acidimicrobiia bacterium]MBT8215250.1 hypothetical protein [Acidimicrobiia bacterium]NNF08746.1 hypothetical protein [Acidimicrobiia bacterium]NNL68356.1 hypothetical protein [Acidimicrobiia bacterium]
MTTTDQSTTTIDISPARTFGVGLAAAVGYVVGFYAGLIALLMITGFDGIADAPFEWATIPAGMLLAGAAGALASPERRVAIAPALGSAAVAAVPTVLGVMALDGDYGHAIVIGGVVAIAATTTAVVTAHRS